MDLPPELRQSIFNKLTPVEQARLSQVDRRSRRDIEQMSRLFKSGTIEYDPLYDVFPSNPVEAGMQQYPVGYSERYLLNSLLPFGFSFEISTFLNSLPPLTTDVLFLSGNINATQTKVKGKFTISNLQGDFKITGQTDDYSKLDGLWVCQYNRYWLVAHFNSGRIQLAGMVGSIAQGMFFDLNRSLESEDVIHYIIEEFLPDSGKLGLFIRGEQNSNMNEEIVKRNLFEYLKQNSQIVPEEFGFVFNYYKDYLSSGLFDPNGMIFDPQPRSFNNGHTPTYWEYYQDQSTVSFNRYKVDMVFHLNEKTKQPVEMQNT